MQIRLLRRPLRAGAGGDGDRHEGGEPGRRAGIFTVENRSKTFPKANIILIQYLLSQSFLSFLYGEGGGLALAGEESLRQLLVLADKYLVEDLKVMIFHKYTGLCVER